MLFWDTCTPDYFEGSFQGVFLNNNLISPRCSVWKIYSLSVYVYRPQFTWEANKGKANDDAISTSFQLPVVQKNQWQDRQYRAVKSRGFGSNRTTFGRLVFMSCVTLGKALNLTKPVKWKQISHLMFDDYFLCGHCANYVMCIHHLISSSK